MEDYTASDHQYVTYTIQEKRVIPPVTARRTAKRWNAARLDKAALRQALQTAPRPAHLTLYNSRESVEALIDGNMRLIAGWCDASRQALV